MKNDNADVIWIKLRKDFFQFKRDLFLGSVYVSPIKSSIYHNQDMESESLLRQDVSKFNKLVIGDIL